MSLGLILGVRLIGFSVGFRVPGEGLVLVSGLRVYSEGYGLIDGLGFDFGLRAGFGL